jgi:hypothetical protein
MNKLLNALIIIAAIYGFFFAIVLAGDQRAFFGKETADFLLIPEIVILGLAGLAIFFIKKQKRRLTIVMVLTSVSCVCFLIGWYVHPERVFKRASDRIIDLAMQKLDQKAKLQNASPEDSKRIKIHLSRLNTERMARKFELKAIELRREGDPEHLKNSVKIYSWWFFAIMSALAAICNYSLSRNSNLRNRMR